MVCAVAAVTDDVAVAAGAMTDAAVATADVLAAFAVASFVVVVVVVVVVVAVVDAVAAHCLLQLALIDTPFSSIAGVPHHRESGPLATSHRKWLWMRRESWEWTNCLKIQDLRRWKNKDELITPLPWRLQQSLEGQLAQLMVRREKLNMVY